MESPESVHARKRHFVLVVRFGVRHSGSHRPSATAPADLGSPLTLSPSDGASVPPGAARRPSQSKPQLVHVARHDDFLIRVPADLDNPSVPQLMMFMAQPQDIAGVPASLLRLRARD